MKRIFFLFGFLLSNMLVGMEKSKQCESNFENNTFVGRQSNTRIEQPTVENVERMTLGDVACYPVIRDSTFQHGDQHIKEQHLVKGDNIYYQTYNYPKANPANSVLTNVLALAKDGAYSAIHTYVAQSIGQKLMIGEQLLTLKVLNWYSGGSKKEQIVGLHNEINKKDFLFARIQKQIKRTEDEESKTNLTNILKDNRLNKYHLVAKISDEAASYFKLSNEMDLAVNENLIKILENHAQQLESEKEHLQTKMYQEIKQKLEANLLKILQT